MTIISLLAFWLFVPCVLIALKELQYRRLRRRREHDLILYAFCDARDLMAIRALRGEIDENSETFKYFYKTIGRLVHDHKNHPIGFGHIAKNLNQNRGRPVPTWVRRLLRELKRSDLETKQVVWKYIEAIKLVMKRDSTVAFLEKLPFWWNRARGNLFKSVSEQPLILSGQKRQFAQFSLLISRAISPPCGELVPA